MKSFFKNTFSTLLALIIFSIFGILFIIFSFSALSEEDERIVDSNSILVMEFDKLILDRTSENPFEGLNNFNLSSNESVEFKDILDNIEKAKNNDNIRGIYLKLSSIPAGFSQIEEIRDKFLDFKESGKFIYSYSESFSQEAYYLASVSDKVYLNPEGYINLNGLSAGVMFYKDLLSKVGIEAQIIRHGKYKSAVEPFMYDAMSKENREQLEKLLNSITDKIISDISDSRGIPEEKIHTSINKLKLNFSSNCKDISFVDEIYYEDEVLDIIEEKVDSYTFISYSDFSKVKTKIDMISENKIAIIYATGNINTGKGDFNSIGSETTVQAIQEARDDENIKAIVFRINSPGGSALASDIIWRELNLAKEKKKVVVSMGDYAASGGYYIACNADRIFANTTTITGSIGVFGVVLNSQELLNDKLGIYIDTVNTHKYSDIGGGSRRLTTYERFVIQTSVENIYETFISHVAEGRGISKDQVDKIGQGRVWSGIDALDIGLIDEIGGLEDAIESAANLAGIDNYRIITLPKKEDVIEEIFEDFLARQSIDITEFSGINKEILDDLKFLYSTDIIQARLPFFMRIN